MPRRLSCVFLLGLLCAFPISSTVSAEMTLTDSPMFIVIDQTFRLIVNSPPSAETVTVKTPPGIEMFDSRIPENDPSTGLFYFRALKTGAMTIVFSSGGSSLDVPVTVLSWEDVLKPRNYQGLELPRIWPVGTADITLKQQRNILSDVDLAALRKPGSQPSEEAQRLSLENIYSSLTGSHVPRNVFVNKTWGKNMTRMGCPVCGLEIYEGRSPFYPWLIDPENHPYQLGCPNCDNWFPSNDYASGDMHSGEFVDDGYGVDFDGYRMGFIGYYSLWYYIRYYLPMVNRLANDYARTGDTETARKAAVALFRIAEQYLNLSINVNQRVEITMRAIWDNKYGTLPPEPELFMSGLYNLNCWGTSAITQLSRVYEILFDYLHESDPEMLAFVRSKNHPSITTMEEYRRFVETGFFRTVTQSFMDLSKVGNLPEGSRALVNFSLFMGTPETRNIIDWVYDGGGEMRFFLTNHFFKDGAAYESQGYNVIHINGFQEVVDGMNELRKRYPDRFPVSSLPLLENDPKYKQLYLFPIHFSLIDRTSPEIGDHGTVVKTDPISLSQTSDLSAPHYLNAFRMTGDRRFAQAFSGPSGKIPAAVPDSLRKQIETIVAEDGWHIPLESEVLDGYGHTVLRSGEGDGQRAVWMRYGRSRGHIQDDMLTIGYEGFKRKLLPELGYPRSWTFRRTWEGNWATHYTGLIRGLESGAERFKGHLTLFAAGEGIQAAGARAPYYLTDNGQERYTILDDHMFDRSIVSVDLTDSTGYVVDVLRMAGGTEHWWSYHSPRGTSTLAGSHTYVRKGTALGAGLAYGETPPGSEGLEALSYMTNVRTGPVIGPWHLDTALENYPDIHVRTTAVEPNYANLILADGSPPGGGEAYSLRWALMHSEGSPGLKTRFTQIIEAYHGRREIDLIIPLATFGGESSQANAVSVSTGGRTDIVATNTTADEAFRIDGGMDATARTAVLSLVEDTPVKLFIADGSRIAFGGYELDLPEPSFTGNITAVDYDKRTFAVSPAVENPDALLGRYLRITNESGNDTAFGIAAIRTVPGGTEITVDADPRIARGYTAGAMDNCVDGAISLPLGIWRYYQGKTIVNHDGSAVYRTSGAYQHGKNHVSTEDWISFEAGELHKDLFKPAGLWIDTERHGTIPAERLKREFVAPDGVSPWLYTVYDFGVGDTVHIGHVVTAVKVEDGWLVTGTSRGTLKTPTMDGKSFGPGDGELIR